MEVSTPATAASDPRTKSALFLALSPSFSPSASVTASTASCSAASRLPPASAAASDRKPDARPSRTACESSSVSAAAPVDSKTPPLRAATDAGEREASESPAFGEGVPVVVLRPERQDVALLPALLELLQLQGVADAAAS